MREVLLWRRPDIYVESSVGNYLCVGVVLVLSLKTPSGRELQEEIGGSLAL